MNVLCSLKREGGSTLLTKTNRLLDADKNPVLYFKQTHMVRTRPIHDGPRQHYRLFVVVVQNRLIQGRSEVEELSRELDF